MPLSVSVVIPVYRGEDTLPALIEELTALHAPQETPRVGPSACPRFSWSGTGDPASATR